MRISVRTDRLIETRIRKGLSQSELANRAGITNGYMSQIEKGTSPGPKKASVIAKALGVEFDEIFLLKSPQYIKYNQKLEGFSA